MLHMAFGFVLFITTQHVAITLQTVVCVIGNIFSLNSYYDATVERLIRSRDLVHVTLCWP